MKNTPTFFLCLLLLILAACSGESPESVLSSYMEAKISGDFQRAYQLLSAEDRQVKSLEEFRGAENASDMQALTDLVQEHTSYEIQDVQMDGDKATAAVDIKIPDLSGMMGDFLALAFQSAFSGEDAQPDEKEIEKMLEKYKGKDMPTKTETFTFQLRKEGDGWKVFLDWKKEQLLKEAHSLEEEEKYAEALEKYQAAYERAPSDTSLENTIKELETKLAALREREAYRDKVEILELQAGYYDTYLDGRIPGVEFKLKNNGDKMLSQVEVTVFFKGEAGNIMHEEQYNPVLVSEYSFGDNKPLKPGYIWRLERGKFLTAKEAPEEWQAGNVEAVVSKVEFAEEDQ